MRKHNMFHKSSASFGTMIGIGNIAARGTTTGRRSGLPADAVAGSLHYGYELVHTT